MKKENQTMTYESAEKNIEGLYQMMLGAAADEGQYRDKIFRELMNLQREDGSWAVIEDTKAPSDIKVAYIFTPTYYATAAIMAYMNAGGILNEEEKVCMEKGLHIAAKRSLNGAGYEAVRSKLNTLSVYKAAGMYEWMKKFGDQYPEFSDMIRREIRGFQLGLITGRTYSDWNIDFSEEFHKEVDDYDRAMDPYVWYAAYGSNISRERFMRYIMDCSDKSEPAEDRRYEFPHDITFAGRAANWSNKGKAFLDDSRKGMALGRIYKIRRSQLDEIQRKEGPDYTKIICLGYEEGIMVYTFTTANMPAESSTPSAEYIDVILKGLKETYPERSELALRAYLFSRNVLSREDRSVLSYIRSGRHGVSLEEITDGSEGLCITKVRKSVRELAALGLIKQDGRSRRTGYRMQDRKAIFYTREENRDLIDILLFVGRQEME